MRINFPARIFLLNFLFLAAFAFGSQTIRAQSTDAMLSFKGFELGTIHDSLSIEQNKTLLKRGKFQKLMRYDLLKDFLRLEGMQLRYVRLFYWQSYLHSIDVKSENGSGNDLREWIEKKYGEGVQEDAMGYKFIWEFPGYRIFLEQNLVTKDASITFLHDEVHNSYYKFMYERSYGK